VSEYTLIRVTQRKYPDAEDGAICSLIGGFFFLRFINPAIVTPRKPRCLSLGLRPH
jgi:hypothetical protein